MSTVALGTPDSNRDMSAIGSISSTPNLTIVSSPRVGTLIPNRIFVGGFPPVTAEHELRTFFEKFGAVKEVKIIRDPSGTSKGYGFITYETEEEAKKIQEKAEPLEFKGRHLNIGPAVRKASSQFKTYDIVPQGAVLCSYGVPYAVQNGITLVAATPDAYAVAQPSQTALSYPVVLPQPMQQVLYPSMPLAAAATQAQQTAAPAVAIAAQHQSSNQVDTLNVRPMDACGLQTAGQPCLAQHIQQNHSSPNSPSKIGTLAYVYEGAEEHVQKTTAPTPLAAYQPNLVPVGIPNIGGLTLNGGAVAQQSPQYRLATTGIASPMAQYVYSNAPGYQGVFQEVTPYPANAYIHPEYAEVYPNGYDNYSEMAPSARKESTPKGRALDDALDAFLGSPNERYFVKEVLLSRKRCSPKSVSLPCSPAGRQSLHAAISRFACTKELFARASRYSPRKAPAQQQQQQYAVSHSTPVNSGSPRYSSSASRTGHRNSAKSVGGHKAAVACTSFEFDPSKGDLKQPPGSVVTPPPTPITTESKG